MATTNEPKPEITEPADATPLTAADILELDYDEEIPTRVDGRFRSERPSMLPPPRVEQNDIYMLTDFKRPSLVLVDASDEVIDFKDVLRTPPRLPDFRRPLPAPTSPPRRGDSMSSIAPVSLSTQDTGPVRAAPERSLGRAKYGLGLGFLAGVALAIAIWPGSNPAPVTASVTQPIQTRETIVMADTTVEAPVVHMLDTVEILGSLTQPAAFGPAVDTSTLGVEHKGATTPVVEAAPPSESEPAAPEEIAPPTPPAPDLPPFDRASAGAAMNAAASTATSCRTDGSPRLPGRVSVTFAPNGRVTTAVVDGATFAGSTVGGCIARTFRSVRVEPFSGPHVTVHKSYTF